MKNKIKSGQFLPVAEQFYSIQGEGCNAGRAAYFVRLAGCNVKCSWCDTKFSWNYTDNQIININSIVESALNFPTKNIVITGGEPLLYNLENICNALHINGFSIWLETSGCEPISGSFDWICVSPKPNRKPLDQVLQIANELKMVIANDEDFSTADFFAKKVSEKCQLLLQSEFSASETILPKITDYVLKNPKWRVSLQTHKILNVD